MSENLHESWARGPAVLTDHIGANDAARALPGGTPPCNRPCGATRHSSALPSTRSCGMRSPCTDSTAGDRHPWREVSTVGAFDEWISCFGQACKR